MRPAPSVAGGEVLLLKVSHDGEGRCVGPLVTPFVHVLMYESHRTWSLIPENGEGMKLLW